MTTVTAAVKGADLTAGQTIAVGVGHPTHYTVTDITFQRPPRPLGIDGRPLSADSLQRLSYLTIRATVTDERGRVSEMSIHRVREYTVINSVA